jgi:hypothetical protein
MLDIVVALDAPDEALLQRVDRRGHWWLSQDRPTEEKRDFYARYRRSFQDALATPVARPPSIVRLRSDGGSPDWLADELLAVLAAGRTEPNVQEERR